MAYRGNFGQTDESRHIFREMIPSDQLSYLRNTPLEENISLHLWSKGEWEFDTLSSYIFAGNNRQMNDHLLNES